MQIVQGAAVTEGFAVAEACILEKCLLTNNRVSIQAEQIQQQIEAFRKAVEKSVDKIKTLQKCAYAEGSQDQEDIFEGYLEIVRDEELFNDVRNCINSKHVDLTTALADVCNDYAADMTALDDPYMQARADDFRQIFRILTEMHTGTGRRKNEISGKFILVADEVGPADMAQTDKGLLSGIVVENGGRTSHAAIICRSMGIPMLSGIKYAVTGIKNGTKLIIDGTNGTLFIHPGTETEQEYDRKISLAAAEKEKMRQFIFRKAVTAAGTEVQLLANIGTVQEIKSALENNADGIGLFRTEFLFMEKQDNRLPTEEEQFISYKTVLEKMEGKPVTFRTLDAGGDKNIAALGIPKEENPFLGWRAIRYCLKNPEIFRTQLRALIRASSYGNCKIMIPMICCESELLQTKKLIDSVYSELEERNESPRVKVPVGIMIETPAAALIADSLAKHVDFFSLGTNDLTQYTVAVDRANEHVSELYDEMHPAVLELITRVVKTALTADIEIHICGEMAGDIRCTETLLKTGIREFSMSANRIPSMKRYLSTLHI